MLAFLSILKWKLLSKQTKKQTVLYLDFTKLLPYWAPPRVPLLTVLTSGEIPKPGSLWLMQIYALCLEKRLSRATGGKQINK